MALPKLAGGSWHIEAAETTDETSARRLAAMLNHQGPQIPAQAVAKDGRYQVLAGPFKDAKTTKTMAKRMRIDLEIKGQIIEPAERISMNNAPESARSKSRIKWGQAERP